MNKKYDVVDYALVGGFMVSLGTMCYMMGTNQVVPELLQTIFWSTAVGLGLKKAPTTLGR